MGKPRRFVHGYLVAFALAASTTPGAAGQEPARTMAPDRKMAGTTGEAVPIRCWWRTSTNAVRVGEPFAVVLTCAARQSGPVTVVPNEAELDPGTLQLPPFDVMGGTHGADQRTANERFLQYEYRVRLLGEELFGKDVQLPDIKISYKVRSRVNGETVEGRDQTYVLPGLPIRVLSLVPAGASDIREAPPRTFSDIDHRLSRANLFRTTGSVFMGLAALAALLPVARVAGRARRRISGERPLLSDAMLLRGLSRELSSIQRARDDGGWTDPLAVRLLTAVRVLSEPALERSVTPLSGIGTKNTIAGQLAVDRGRLGGNSITLPGWVTPGRIAEARRAAEAAGTGADRAMLLEELEETLSRLTSVQYGRGVKDPADVLDGALASALRMSRSVKSRNTWMARSIRALRRAVSRSTA